MEIGHLCVIPGNGSRRLQTFSVQLIPETIVEFPGMEKGRTFGLSPHQQHFFLRQGITGALALFSIQVDEALRPFCRRPDTGITQFQCNRVH